MSLASEFASLLAGVLFGFALGFSYHALFVLRVLCGVSAGGAIPARLAAFRFPYLCLAGQKARGARARQAMLFLFDFLFALWAGLAFCVFLYAVHDGAFRLFLAVAAAVGMFLYFVTLGRLVARVLGTAAYLLRVVLGYLFLCVRIPLCIFFGALLFFLQYLFFFLIFLCGRLCAPIFSRLSLHAVLRTGRALFLACEKNL